MNLPRDECEDAAQEAWLQAVEHPELFRGEHAVSQLCAWLLRRVILGKVADAFHDLKEQSAQSLDSLTREPMDPRAGREASGEDWHEWLTAKLERLQRENPDNCEMICEHYLQERSIQELADERGWTTNEISCRLYRGMEKLRRWASEFHRGGEAAP